LIIFHGKNSPHRLKILLRSLDRTKPTRPNYGFKGRHEPDKLGENALLFLRHAVWHSTESKRQHGGGLRTLDGVSFNEGRLCPKGVQRYLQNNHPDRLLSPLQRVEGKGFEPVDWETAMSKTVSEIKRIQSAYGNDAFRDVVGCIAHQRKKLHDRQVCTAWH
jgi:assimilatory nitrate reductase catalytic subunit